MSAAVITASRPNVEELERALQCPATGKVMARPVHLACGHVLDRAFLIHQLSSLARGALQGFLLSPILCPLAGCNRTFRVVSASPSHLVQTQLQAYRSHYQERFQKREDSSREDAGRIPRKFRNFAESMVEETPIADIQSFLCNKPQRLTDRIAIELYPALRDLGLLDTPCSFKNFTYSTTLQNEMQFDIDFGTHIFTLSVSRENHLDIQRIRPATWQEYFSHRWKFTLEKEVNWLKRRPDSVVLGLSVLLGTAASLLGFSKEEILPAVTTVALSFMLTAKATRRICGSRVSLNPSWVSPLAPPVLFGLIKASGFAGSFMRSVLPQYPMAALLTEIGCFGMGIKAVTQLAKRYLSLG